MTVIEPFFLTYFKFQTNGIKYERQFKKMKKYSFLRHSLGHISGMKGHGHERFYGFLSLIEAYLWPKDEAKRSESVGIVPSLDSLKQRIKIKC
jgi:hypothetical protein